MKSDKTLQELKDEIHQIRKSYPRIKDDSAFVFWFLRTLLDSDEQINKALTGISNDKGIDALWIDYKAKQVNIIQGKFRQSLGKHNENRNDVKSFAEIGLLSWKDREFLEAFYSNLDPLVANRIQELIRLVRTKNYSINLYYVTTGRCSKTIRDECEKIVKNSNETVRMFIFDANQIVPRFEDYLVGVAPAVQSLSLRMDPQGFTKTEGAIRRFDPEKQIETWVFSMSAKDVGDMYKNAGVQLFARNIRGYLGGKKEINEAMADTVKQEPNNFWYYNNGVTIVCDEAEETRRGGQMILEVQMPQVINGQQTTRTLANISSTRASVLVKAIKIPRKPGDDDSYDDMVSKIVRATNWQNPIDLSDLISNDHIQVFLEREFAKMNYQYIRKKQNKSEARQSFGRRPEIQIHKERMAQAVAACLFDPVTVRKGMKGLFDDRYYRSIFGSRDIFFYLSKYFLMDYVGYVAHGYPRRSYPKWLVLNFAWKLLSDIIESGIGAKQFKQMWEKEIYKTENHLCNALSGIFKAAHAFFELERGKGEEAKDISTFYLKSDLHKKFAKFWRTSKNKHRKKVENQIKQFKESLRKVEII